MDKTEFDAYLARKAEEHDSGWSASYGISHRLIDRVVVNHVCELIEGDPFIDLDKAYELWERAARSKAIKSVGHLRERRIQRTYQIFSQEFVGPARFAEVLRAEFDLSSVAA